MAMLQQLGTRGRAAMAGFTPGQVGVIAVGVIGLVLAGFVFLRWSAPPMARTSARSEAKPSRGADVPWRVSSIWEKWGAMRARKSASVLPATRSM